MSNTNQSKTPRTDEAHKVFCDACNRLASRFDELANDPKLIERELEQCPKEGWDIARQLETELFAAIAERDKWWEVAERLVDGLRHMGWCGQCAEENWDQCEQGSKAQQAIKDFDQLNQPKV